MHRFTAYLNDKELAQLNKQAEEHACSKNYLVRNALRGLLGLPVPAWVTDILREAKEL